MSKLLSSYLLQFMFLGFSGSDFQSCLQSSLVVSEVFCLPDSYRKDVPPQTDGPLNVFFKLPITEVSEVNDHKSQLTIRLAYKLRWPESRMLLNSSADWSRGEINVMPGMIKHFWTPDIIIHDLVSFTKPKMLNEVAALEIIQDHSVYYKIRSDITIVCKGMQFSRYPLDQHSCMFKLSSFGYDTTQIRLSGKFSHNPTNQRVLQFHTAFKELDIGNRFWSGSSKNYSIYGLEILLTRSLSPFILSVYLPSGMFVVMSWVSFFIPPDIVPARIVLLVTLCLVLINMFNSTTSRIPVSNSVTAIEIWLLACVLLVFLTLVEYAVILREGVKRRTIKNNQVQEYLRQSSYHDYPKNIQKKRHIITKIDKSVNVIQMVKSKSANYISSNLKQPSFHRLSLAPYADSSPSHTEYLIPAKEKACEQAVNESRYRHYQIMWDKNSAIVFPALFIMFNILYWSYYFIWLSY